MGLFESKTKTLELFSKSVYYIFGDIEKWFKVNVLDF